jgi:hypothetical protein
VKEKLYYISKIKEWKILLLRVVDFTQWNWTHILTMGVQCMKKGTDKVRSIETYKIIKNCQNFHEVRRSSKRHAHVDTHTNNKRVFNWIEFNISSIASKCVFVLHVCTTWIETAEIPQFDIQHYCYYEDTALLVYCQLDYTLHVTQLECILWPLKVWIKPKSIPDPLQFYTACLDKSELYYLHIYL